MPAQISGSQSGTIGLLNPLTAVNSTSGTAIDFTGIPSGAKRITIAFNGVSLSGSANVLVQIGSGSPTTSGYVGQALVTQTSGAVSALSTGFLIYDNSPSTSNVLYGLMTIINLNANIWVCSSTMGDTGRSALKITGGSVSLAGVLDRVRITSTNGTDTFDAGSINILYQ
jgi:hypothetical protein